MISQGAIECCHQPWTYPCPISVRRRTGTNDHLFQKIEKMVWSGSPGDLDGARRDGCKLVKNILGPSQQQTACQFPKQRGGISSSRAWITRSPTTSARSEGTRNSWESACDVTFILKRCRWPTSTPLTLLCAARRCSR